MKEIEELIDDEYIVMSPKGVAIKGNSATLLTLYSQITREMQELKGVNKEMIKQAFDMAFMEKDELVDLLKIELNKFADKLKDIVKDKKSDE